MFENSARAGIAGNRQWGLDAGDHEHGWNPYLDLPEEWVYNNRKEGEGELEVSFPALPRVRDLLTHEMTTERP
ncbi:hypothetical protein CPC08DRAFT_644448 [Agrocybe pediades]|nr:hypothetical protein CPC08DRAFT_644448 [Agrocybe pediades]